MKSTPHEYLTIANEPASLVRYALTIGYSIQRLRPPVRLLATRPPRVLVTRLARISTYFEGVPGDRRLDSLLSHHTTTKFRQNVLRKIFPVPTVPDPENYFQSP